jgi:DNA repair protein RadD
MQYSLLEASAASAVESKPMRDHQAKFFSDCREAIRRGDKRIIGCAPVGWGKTRLAAEMFKGSYQRGKTSMFTTPRNALIEPSVEEFEEQGLTDIGIIQQDHPRTNPHAKLQVASIHTAVNRELPIIHLVVDDEVHMNTKEFNALVDSEEWKNIIVIGLSATPWKKGMGLRWKTLIQTKSTSQLIDEGYLVRPRYMVGSETPSIAGRKTHLDEDGNRVLSEKDEAAAMGDVRIIGDVVQTYIKHGEGRSGFYYAVNLAHARSLRDEFERAGIKCGYIDGTMSREERHKVIRLYREGHYRIVVNFGVLTTGVDEDVRIIGICRIILAEIDWVQIIGRGLRTDNPRKRVKGCEPKVDCLVIDHGGNLTRDDGTAMAPAEDIYHDYLDTHDPADKKKKAYEEDAKPATHRKCKKCGALIPPKTKRCPSCGDEIWDTEHGVVAVNAEFREFGGVKPEKQPKPKKAKKDEKQEFWSGFLYMAEERGDQNGWTKQKRRSMALAKYQERFGCWPSRLQDLPSRPSAAVRRFDAEKRREFYASKKETVKA